MADITRIPQMTMWMKVKDGDIWRHCNLIKPLLTETNKATRLQFFLSLIQASINKFHDMYNVVHIDGKCFYMTTVRKWYYHSNDGERPIGTCKSKRCIDNVMFLDAVPHPRYDHHFKQMFLSKIEIWFSSWLN